MSAMLVNKIAMISRCGLRLFEEPFWMTYHCHWPYYGRKTDIVQIKRCQISTTKISKSLMDCLALVIHWFLAHQAIIRIYIPIRIQLK